MIIGRMQFHIEIFKIYYFIDAYIPLEHIEKIENHKINIALYAKSPDIYMEIIDRAGGR